MTHELFQIAIICTTKGHNVYMPIMHGSIAKHREELCGGEEKS